MRLILATMLVAGRLLATLMAAPSAQAEPETCPPICDQIPATAWISTHAVPLNSQYRWPAMAGAAVAVTRATPRFGFEQVCATPAFPHDSRDWAVAGRVTVVHPDGQWQLQAQVGAEVVSLWHADADLKGVDAVVVPGGFSYGDYLRAGAIARFAPVMDEVVAAADRGMPVLGICNGFQVLCEAGLLPGALTRNVGLHFICRDVWLRVASTSTAWTSRFEPDADLLVPLKSGEGRYVAPEKVLDELEGEGRVVFRYHDNVNGSLRDIAGICSANGRVVGLMPHPEHAIEALTGPSDDGLGLFYSALDAVLTG
ncbi:phosphoribosylformylglycinamidine synthase [Mycobacterium tuberculosis]|nr:phosphoribosylformylglycinamidine synthase [Mycobacterium tuberculosis]